MADYRDWCGSCHREINFGGHDPDCDYLHAERIAYKEAREFEDSLRKQYSEKSDEAVLEEAVALDKEIEALSRLLRAKEHKMEFITREVFMERSPFKLREELAKRLGRRFL